MFGILVLTLVMHIAHQVECDEENYLSSPGKHTTLEQSGNHTPTPDDLLKDLELLEKDITSFTTAANEEFVKDFTQFLLKATSKQQRFCITNQFANYFTDVAQYLTQGFKDTETNKVGYVMDVVQSSSPAEIQLLIQQVNDVTNLVADHKVAWKSYIRPFSDTNEQKYKKCLGIIQ